MITKDIWYDVRYTEPVSVGDKVHTRVKVKSFKDRKKAQQFFDELSNDYNKWLVLVEESILDVVY